jgi:hypothetical protein
VFSAERRDFFDDHLAKEVQNEAHKEVPLSGYVVDPIAISLRCP